MKVTVIIPAYNASKYIKRCVMSLKNQTYKNIEIIVINDGSTDNTKEIVEKLNVKLINKENGGVSSARNMGLKIATGDYITFVDSDDYVEKNYIESVVDIINKKDYDIIETPLLFEAYRKGKVLLYTEYKLKGDKESLDFSKGYFDNELRYVIGVFNKSKIINNLYFDEDVRCYEDGMFNIRAKLRSNTYYFYPKCFYHYIQYLTSLSKKISDKHLDYKIVMERVSEDVKDNKYLTRYIENIFKNNVLSIILFKLPYFKNNKYKYKKELVKALKKYAPNYSKKHKITLFILNGYILISIWFFIIQFFNMNKIAIKFQSKNTYNI